MNNLVFMMGLAAQGLLTLWVLGLSLRTQIALRGWIEASKDPASAEAGAKKLPEPERGIATEMTAAVRLRSTLDDALVKALVRAADEPWSPTALLGLHVVTMVLALAPACIGLVNAALKLSIQAQTLAPLHAAARYLHAPAALNEVFESLKNSLGDSAILLVSLCVIWALAWAIARPQVREARFVHTMLQVAVRIRPGTPAPVAGRLAEWLAPHRSLARPIAASVVWFVAITAGWAILLSTASLRASNQADAQYNVWPKKGRAPISLGEELHPPRVVGGQPFQDHGFATITVGPMQALFQGQAFADLDSDGNLAGDWPPAPAPSMQKALAKSKAVTILAHREVSANQTLIPILRWLHEGFGVEDFHLLVARDLPDGQVQADLLLSIAKPNESPGITVTIAADTLSVGQVRVPLSRNEWRRDVRTAVRRIEELFDPKAPLSVRVTLSGEVDYARFARSLGAADSSCFGKTDCGLPGLGLRLVVTP